MSVTADLIATLNLRLPQGITVYDGPQPRDQTGPCVCVYGGSEQPANRRYGATSQTRGRVWSIVCCSNNIDGARIVSHHVIDVVDALDLDSNLMAVLNVSSPIEDRDDPSGVSWSITVETSHYQPA